MNNISNNKINCYKLLKTSIKKINNNNDNKIKNNINFINHKICKILIFS